MFGKTDKMDVRCHSDSEAARVSKNAHKESRENKGAEGNLPAAFLKEPQGAFSAPGAAEDCNKSKPNSAADPDYCRRILVRGRDGAGLRGAFFGGRLRGRYPPRPARGGRAEWDFGESCWPSLPRVWPANGDSHLGRALSRSLDPPSPEGPAGWAAGGAGGCAGGPRLQAVASDTGKGQGTLVDTCAPCAREDLPGARPADSRALAS